MSGLSFENAAPVIASAPERADIACFVGYVRLRDGAAPPQPVQKRWPMALSIWAAVAVSLAMWAGIVWIISLFMGLFA